MLVYLAEPIDFHRGEPHSDDLALRVAAAGHSVFRPYTAWYGTSPETEHGGHVQHINRSALDRAGMLVARLPADTRSVGVPMEIAWAVDAGIPAVVLTDIAGSASLSGSPWIITIDNVEMIEWALGQAKVLINTLPGDANDLRYTKRGAPLQRAYPTDAGLDLTTVEECWLQPGQRGFINCGVAVQYPPGTFGWVAPRSSALNRWGLMIVSNVIDPGYTGELGVQVYRVPNWEGDTHIPAGTRLGQLVLLLNQTARYNPIVVSSIEGGARGSNGFGSSGH